MNRKWIKNGLTLFFLAIMVYAGSQLFLIIQEYRQGDAVYETAQTDFVEPPPEELIAEDEDPWPEFRVDFAELTKVNAEVCGWLYMEDTVINYPIVKSESSNDAYIKTTYDGIHNSAGSIFADYRNHRDFSDGNTIIYGHNMKNGKMFGGLKRFRSQEYADSHKVFYIITETEIKRYQVVSAFETDALSDIYTRNFSTEQEKQKWIDKIVHSSNVGTDASVNTADTFVTLSTCISGNDYRARYVVIGVLAGKEYILPQNAEK